MKQRQKFNVLVLGSGAAGMEAAERLALGGKTVALVENNALGGTAYHDGALPVKGLLDAFKGSSFLSAREVLSSWQSRLVRLKQLNGEKINNPNIAFFLSQGEFIDSNSYEIQSIIIEAEQIIIATGTRPKSPFTAQIDEKQIVSHRYLLQLPAKVEEIIILGGNVEGFELAFVFSSLGFSVTLVEKEKSLLPGNDKDLIYPLQKALEELGCKIIVNASVQDVYYESGQVTVLFENGEKIHCSKVLLTLVREVNLPEGIEKLELKTENRFILTDRCFKTNQKNIYAIGDVNGVHGMAHVAWDQGRIVADEILGKEVNQPEYSLIPRVIFTNPELAGAGLQETDCRAQNISYRVGKADFAHSYRGWSLNQKSGFVKALIGKEDQLLGLWLAGEGVGEKIGFLNYFVANHIKVQSMIETLTINPSLDETVKQALINALEGEKK